MDLKLSEQRLVNDFRRLPSAGQEELLEFAGSLLTKYRDQEGDEKTATGQCKLERAAARPEVAKEPVFTE